MEYTEIIERFGRDHGIDGLPPDEDGCCDFDVDNLPVHVFALPGTERLVVWGEVCPLPTHGVATFLSALMRGSCLGLETEGCSFTIDPTSDTVCLQWIQPLEGLTYESFTARIESFVNMLERWQAFADEFDVASEDVGKIEQAEADERTAASSDMFLQV